MHNKDPVKHKYEKELVPGYYNHNPELEDYLKDDKNFRITEIKDNNGCINHYSEEDIINGDYDVDIEDKSYISSDFEIIENKVYSQDKEYDLEYDSKEDQYFED